MVYSSNHPPDMETEMKMTNNTNNLLQSIPYSLTEVLGFVFQHLNYTEIASLRAPNRSAYYTGSLTQFHRGLRGLVETLQKLYPYNV